MWWNFRCLKGKIKKFAVVMFEIDPLNFLGSVHAEFLLFLQFNFEISLLKLSFFYFKTRRRLLFHVVSGQQIQVAYW